MRMFPETKFNLQHLTVTYWYCKMFYIIFPLGEFNEFKLNGESLNNNKEKKTSKAFSSTPSSF